MINENQARLNKNTEMIITPNVIKLAKKEKLVEDLLLISGFTKSGKFTFANFVNTIADVEHYQYCPLLEHLAALVKLDLINLDLAKAMIQIEVDNAAYDLMVGRSINFRYGDRSSIYKSPKLDEYLQRCLNPDGDEVVKKIKSKKRYYCYIGHEVFHSIKIFMELYPKIKVLELERHPVDLIYSWYKSGWGNRFGLDLKDFSLPFEGINFPVPWFATRWAEEYENSSEMDRIIKSIYYVNQMNKEAWSELSQESKLKIHKVCFEKILTNPDEELKKVADFLGKEIIINLGFVKSREKIPTEDPKNNRNQKLKCIEEKASPNYFKMLLELQEEYEARWNH